ncbi:DUF952 domain-containing protein [Halomonas elongata]|uniref:DUF952 domain-containing protein n=1 Tax=Halomonas elongata TaxID=2746 RepID=UPI0023B10848|nr:DUF952 domain-containing protein [Halomonas elongata]
MEPLYRVLPEATWEAACRSGKVSRCGNDHRADGVHLNVAAAVDETARRYFAREERPLVLEVDPSGFAECIEWREPTEEEPWPRPLARIEALPTEAVIAIRRVEAGLLER